MPITATKVGDRTIRRGSETYANGMTLTFHDPDNLNDSMPNCARLLDMKHARSWLANDGGEPVYAEEKGDTDMGGRGKRYSVGATGKQMYVSGRGKTYEISAAEAEVLRRTGASYAKSEYRRKRNGNRSFSIDR